MLFEKAYPDADVLFRAVYVGGAIEPNAEALEVVQMLTAAAKAKEPVKLRADTGKGFTLNGTFLITEVSVSDDGEEVTVRGVPADRVT